MRVERERMQEVTIFCVCSPGSELAFLLGDMIGTLVGRNRVLEYETLFVFHFQGH